MTRQSLSRYGSPAKYNSVVSGLYPSAPIVKCMCAGLGIVASLRPFFPACGIGRLSSDRWPVGE